MPRLTHLYSNGKYITEEINVSFNDRGVGGAAIEKLAVFETVFEELVQEQETLSQKLQEMRVAGKTSSYRYKEIMGQKLVNSSVISIFQRYGLKP